MKRCPVCKLEKPLSKFNSQGKCCRICHNERNRKWRENNKDKMKASRKKYEDSRSHVSDNESLRCGSCSTEKKGSDFSFRNKEKGIRQRTCKECSKTYTRNYYNNNSQRILSNKKKRKQKYRVEKAIWLISFFKKNPCVDCGESDPLCLTFDHVRGQKDFNISRGVTSFMENGKFLHEIEKCEVRCANCHMKKTAKDLNWTMWQILQKGDVPSESL